MPKIVLTISAELTALETAELLVKGWMKKKGQTPLAFMGEVPDHRPPSLSLDVADIRLLNIDGLDASNTYILSNEGIDSMIGTRLLNLLIGDE